MNTSSNTIENEKSKKIITLSNYSVSFGLNQKEILEGYKKNILKFFTQDFTNFFEPKDLRNEQLGFEIIDSQNGFKIQTNIGIIFEFGLKNNGAISNLFLNIHHPEKMGHIQELYIEAIINKLNDTNIDFTYIGGTFGNLDPITNQPFNCESGICQAIAGIKGELFLLDKKVDKYKQVLEQLVGNNFLELDKINIEIFDPQLSRNIICLKELFGSTFQDNNKENNNVNTYENEKIKAIFYIVGKTYETLIVNINIYIEHLQGIGEGINQSKSYFKNKISNISDSLRLTNNPSQIEDKVLAVLSSSKEIYENDLEEIQQILELENKKKGALEMIIANKLPLRAIIKNIEGELPFLSRIASKLNMYSGLVQKQSTNILDGKVEGNELTDSEKDKDFIKLMLKYRTTEDIDIYNDFHYSKDIPNIYKEQPYYGFFLRKNREILNMYSLSFYIFLKRNFSGVDIKKIKIYSEYPVHVGTEEYYPIEAKMDQDKLKIAAYVGKNNVEILLINNNIVSQINGSIPNECGLSLLNIETQNYYKNDKKYTNKIYKKERLETKILNAETLDIVDFGEYSNPEFTGENVIVNETQYIGMDTNDRSSYWYDNTLYLQYGTTNILQTKSDDIITSIENEFKCYHSSFLLVKIKGSYNSFIINPKTLKRIMHIGSSYKNVEFQERNFHGMDLIQIKHEESGIRLYPKDFSHILCEDHINIVYFEEKVLNVNNGTYLHVITDNGEKCLVSKERINKILRCKSGETIKEIFEGVINIGNNDYTRILAGDKYGRNINRRESGMCYIDNNTSSILKSIDGDIVKNISDDDIIISGTKYTKVKTLSEKDCYINTTNFEKLTHGGKIVSGATINAPGQINLKLGTDTGTTFLTIEG